MSRIPSPPKALFSRGFDDIATRWHKNPGAAESDLPLIREQMKLEGLAVAEGLLVAPKMSFRVFGENVVLCRLLEMFGVRGVETLLEEGALEFVLWTPMVATVETPIPGVFPVVSGQHSSAAHSEPDASVALGLRGWCGIADARLLRLKKLATDRTWVPPVGVAEIAVSGVRTAYEQGYFENEGIGLSLPPHSLSRAQRKVMGAVGESFLEAAVLVESDYAFLDSLDAWQALLRTTTANRSDTLVKRTTEHVLTLEGLPSIAFMIENGALKFSDIVALRRADATKEFQRWLWSQPDPGDSRAVGLDYARRLNPKSRVTNRDSFKAVRVAFMSAIGAAVSGVAAAAIPPGKGQTAAIAAVAAGTILNYLDAFPLEKLIRSNNPRRFADEELRPRLARIKAKEYQAPKQADVAPAGGQVAAKEQSENVQNEVRTPPRTRAERNKAKAKRRAQRR